MNTWDVAEPNTAILVHIHQTLKEEPSLHTTITTIGSTATLAWSLDQGIIVDFGRYFYLQAPSPPRPNSLDFLLAIGQTTNQHFIAKHFHATTTPMFLSAEIGYINTHHNSRDRHPIITTARAELGPTSPTKPYYHLVVGYNGNLHLHSEPIINNTRNNTTNTTIKLKCFIFSI